MVETLVGFKDFFNSSLSKLGVNFTKMATLTNNGLKNKRFQKRTINKMATTFLDYKNDKGFYIHETYAQLVFQFIYHELQKSQYTLINKSNSEQTKLHFP